MEEVKKIVEQLAVINERGKKLLYDSVFLTCLSEEIAAFWKQNDIKEAFVCFKLTESNDLEFSGVYNNIDENLISIPIFNTILIAEDKDFENFAAEDVEKIIERYKQKKQQEIEEKKKQLEQSIETLNRISLEEKKHKLLDKLLKGQ